MSTLKSLLPQAFAVSDVHPRPRKRLARCTLDCGFKTSESPALRGFVAERAPIRGTSLYLVLKSNGLHRPKIRLKKFGFSPKIVPANISKKLPAQVLSQIVFQPLAQMAHVCLHSESGYTLGFRRKIAHNGLHAETQAFTLVQPCRASDRPSSGKRIVGGSGCTSYGVCPLPPAPQPRWAALPCLKFGDLLFSHSALSTFCVCEVEAVSLPSACSTCCRNPRCPLVKTTNLLFP